MNSKYRGHKLDTHELQNLIFESDIFGLGETMETYSSNLFLEGYEVFNFSGFKKSKKGRSSGGFIILIKRWLMPFVKWLKSSRDHKYCKWLQLQLPGNEPLTLGFIYIPPADSNVHLYFEEPLFDTINEEIFEFKDQGLMLILGDLNARLGNLKDDQDLEELSSFWKLDLSPRHNIDQTSNTFGMELLQLCYKQNMKILNGRWGDNSDKWTYVSDTGGTSVIDWALAN